jgi:hypothetical protein
MNPVKIYITENDVSFENNSISQNRYFKTRINIFKYGILHNGQLNNFRACILPEMLSRIDPISPIHAWNNITTTLYEDYQNYMIEHELISNNIFLIQSLVQQHTILINLFNQYAILPTSANDILDIKYAPSPINPLITILYNIVNTRESVESHIPGLYYVPFLDGDEFVQNVVCQLTSTLTYNCTISYLCLSNDFPYVISSSQNVNQQSARVTSFTTSPQTVTFAPNVFTGIPSVVMTPIGGSDIELQSQTNTNFVFTYTTTPSALNWIATGI